jgi:hypothetical protein
MSISESYQQRFHREHLERRARLFPKASPPKPALKATASPAVALLAPKPDAPRHANNMVAHPEPLNNDALLAFTFRWTSGDLRTTVEPQPPLKIDTIIRTVATHFDVTRLDMVSRRRTANIVLPRQVAMFLAKMLTPHSLPHIGRQFGGKDHATVLHAVRKIAARIEGDAEFAEHIASLRAKLSALA